MEDEKVGYSTLKEAIGKAKEIGERIRQKLGCQDRVFIKVGNLYYNPDGHFSKGLGVS